MFVILAYAPALLALPFLLVAGLVFVVVPGGFIVVLIGLYYLALAGLSYAFAELTSLIGRGRSMRRRDRTPRRRAASTSSKKASPSRRPPFVSPGDPIPAAVGFVSDRAAGPSANLVFYRRRTGDLDRIRALDARRAPDRQDRTAA